MKNPRLTWQPFGIMTQVIIFESAKELQEMLDVLIKQEVWFDIDFVENGIVGITTTSDK